MISIFCVLCGKKLSRYNKFNICYDCRTRSYGELAREYMDPGRITDPFNKFDRKHRRNLSKRQDEWYDYQPDPYPLHGGPEIVFRVRNKKR